MERLNRLAVKIFADGADGILALYKNPLIRGFTTNPSLMRKAGVDDYEEFARGLLLRFPTVRFPSRYLPTSRTRWYARRERSPHGDQCERQDPGDEHAAWLQRAGWSSRRFRRGDCAKDLSTGLRDNVNPRALLVVGSITDGQVVREAVAAVDACVHLAAIASVGRFNEDWAGCDAVNQSAFVALLQFVARRPKGRIPLVYVSSAAVYGNSTQLPICETAVARPLSGCGADKLGCESHARAAGEAGGVATFGLRFFNVYGVGQRLESPYAGVRQHFRRPHPAGRAAQHLWRREPKPRFRSRGRRRSSCARGIGAHVDYRPGA